MRVCFWRTVIVAVSYALVQYFNCVKLSIVCKLIYGWFYDYFCFIYSNNLAKKMKKQ